MSLTLVIHPTGPVETHDTPPGALAEQVIAGPPTVITCHHPALTGRTHVLFLGDFSALDGSPLNRRAWALYGGSPVHGTVVLAADDRQPLDPDVVALVTSDGFPDPDLCAVMDRWLVEHS